MKTFGFNAEELKLIVKYSTEADMFGEPKEDSLIAAELDALAKRQYTLGLMIKARRILALVEINKLNKVDGPEPITELKYYATRAELTPLEDSADLSANLTWALFKALEKKGIITEDELKDVVRNIGEGEITWDG